jgi:hypothetical protein
VSCKEKYDFFEDLEIVGQVLWRARVRIPLEEVAATTPQIAHSNKHGDPATPSAPHFPKLAQSQQHSCFATGQVTGSILRNAEVLSCKL